MAEALISSDEVAWEPLVRLTSIAIGIGQVVDTFNSHWTMDGSLFRWLLTVSRCKRVVTRKEESEEMESGRDGRQM